MTEYITSTVEHILTQLRKVVFGQDEAIEQILVALLAEGHALIEGVPGTAKTLTVKTLFRIINANFGRIQFMPDLMPSDITGTNVFNLATSTFNLRRGPVFTDILLADEINRTPPKTQAALLEAMEERQVTIDGDSHPLPDPFVVIATQNPVEYEGTYPLPEAQLYLFLFKLNVPYPTAEQEQAVLARHDAGLDPHDVAAAGVRAVAGVDDLTAARAAVEAVRCEAAVQAYIVAIARATRTSPSVSLGVSPRGAVSLLHASKAWAWLAGKAYVTPDEVKAVAKAALRHRLQLRPEVELEGGTADAV